MIRPVKVIKKNSITNNLKKEKIPVVSIKKNKTPVLIENGVRVPVTTKERALKYLFGEENN